MASNKWFLSDSGKVFMIRNVTKVTIGTPLIARSYYRDLPPVIAGGISAWDGVDEAIIATIGVNPSATGFTDYVKAVSSVEESDDYAHEKLRFVWHPEPMIFFETTDDATATNPTSATFPIERPADRTPAEDTFDAFDVDACFPWTENCGVFNVPPPGWSPGSET